MSKFETTNFINNASNLYNSLHNDATSCLMLKLSKLDFLGKNHVIVQSNELNAYVFHS